MADINIGSMLIGGLITTGLGILGYFVKQWAASISTKLKEMMTKAECMLKEKRIKELIAHEKEMREVMDSKVAEAVTDLKQCIKEDFVREVRNIQKTTQSLGERIRSLERTIKNGNGRK